MDAPALRIIQGESQQAFPWLHEDPNKVLAIPPGDVECYRIRLDVMDCRWTGIDRRLVGDARYHAFLELAEKTRFPPGLLVLGLWLMAGELANRPDGPMGVGQHGQNLARMTIKRWCLPEDHEEAFEAALRIGLQDRVKMFTVVDTSRPEQIGAYSCVRARTHANAQSRAGPRARGRQTDSQTDENPSTPAGHAPPDPPPPAEDGAADVAPSAPMLLARLVPELRDRRRRLGQSEYPGRHGDAGGLDMQDLRAAIMKAVVTDRVGELEQRLEETCKWAQNGRGFRKSLKDGGFL